FSASACTCRAFSSDRTLPTEWKPRLASSITAARPIPEFAPVTSTVSLIVLRSLPNGPLSIRPRGRYGSMSSWGRGYEMDTRRMRMMLAAIAAAALVLTQNFSASAFSGGGFIVLCDYSHTLSDDPIVYPQQPGASHSHD